MTESMRGLMRGELDRESPEHYTRFTLYTVGRAEVEATGDEAEFPRIAPAVTGRRNRYLDQCVTPPFGLVSLRP